MQSFATRVTLGCCATLVATLICAPSSSADPDGPDGDTDKPTIAEVQRRLDVLSHRSEIASEQLNAVRVEMQGAQERLQTLEADVTAQRGRVDRLRSRVVGTAVDNYMSASSTSPTTAFFTADDAGQLLDEMATNSMVADQQAGLLVRLTQQQKQLGIREQQAEAAVDALTEDKREAAQRQAELDGSINDAKELLAQLEEEERQRVLALQRAAARREAAAQREAQREAQAAQREARAAQREARAAQREARAAQRETVAAQPRSEAAAQPPSEPAAQPPSEPAAQPPSEPAAQPPSEAAAQPPSEAAAQPRSEAAAQPPSEAAARPPREPSTTRSAPRVNVADVAVSDRAQIAVQTALAQVGDAYVYGAAGPDAFDCSGLTMYSWAAAGVSISHASSVQPSQGTPVSISSLQPGDLVFYYSPISHVGIYVGNGQLVHAANPSRPVEVVSVYSMPIAMAIRIA